MGKCETGLKRWKVNVMARHSRLFEVSQYQCYLLFNTLSIDMLHTFCKLQTTFKVWHYIVTILHRSFDNSPGLGIHKACFPSYRSKNSTTIRRKCFVNFSDKNNTLLFRILEEKFHNDSRLTSPYTICCLLLPWLPRSV